MNPKINPAKANRPSRNARIMQATSKMILSAPAKLDAKAVKHHAAAVAVLNKSRNKLQSGGRCEKRLCLIFFTQLS